MELLPTTAPLTLHSYDDVNVPSSWSYAVELQVNKVPVVTAKPGEILTLDTDGLELPTVALDDVLETDAPFESVALAEHKIVSPGETKLLVNCHVEPELVAPLEAVHE